MALNKDVIKARAESHGFSFVGFTEAKATPHLNAYLKHIRDFEHSDLAFLSRSYVVNGRRDPTCLMDNASTVIVLGVCYPPPQTNNKKKMIANGTIAAYAVMPDYHDVIREKATLVVHSLQKECTTTFKTRIFIDSGPMMEKDMAYSAGLGWIGKNTLCIHPKYGSFFFICCILTDLNLDADDFFNEDLCGDCQKCEIACPTNCIHDHRIDVMRCISYLTAEHRGVIPHAMRKQIGNRIFGCDICQSVCPRNVNTKKPENGYFFHINPKLKSQPDLCEQLKHTPVSFKEYFSGTPILRIGYERYVRNIVVAAGNSGNDEYIPLLKRLVTSSSELISLHAAWALTNFEDNNTRDFLLGLLNTNINKELKKEISELVE